MMHLRLSGQSFDLQRQELETIIRSSSELMMVLEGLREMALNDWWVVSGALYNNVWNHLSGRPIMTGVKDIDVFYFDDSDLSYEAEDLVIKKAAPVFADLSVPVEIRNQARVHLWYDQHFGRAIPPLTSCTDSISRFAAQTHCVAVRLEHDDSLCVHAPFGLDDIFSFRIVPNRVNENADAYANKAERALFYWPELEVVPW